MYQFLRPLLFRLPPELSHELSMDWLAAGHRLGLSRMVGPPPKAAVTAMGLKFPNPVGLAAGLDKNGDFVDALGALGFGFVEVGTITPRPQPGNPQPRLFRLPEQQAIINRMGFNNKGCAHLVERLKKRRYSGVLGINIGKNKDTPDAQALEDYKYCLEQVYPYADYITINISSPNTPGLRALQFGEQLKKLLGGIKSRQRQLAGANGRRVPLAVKIAPDLTDEQVREVAATLVATGMDAAIATNTTISRAGVEDSDFAAEAGGLSGAPVEALANRVLATLRSELPAEIPIIGVGGVRDGASAARKLAAGASLLQVYTGFIYGGPAVIRAAVDAYIHHRPL